MVANDYYNSDPNKPHRRSDAPLPPVPDYELSHRLNENHPSPSPSQHPSMIPRTVRTASKVNRVLTQSIHTTAPEVDLGLTIQVHIQKTYH